MLSNSLQIRVNSQGVETIRRISGIPIVRNVNIHDIADIEQTMGLQSNTGNKARVYYKLKLKQKNVKKLVVGDSLPSASSAAYIREKMLVVLNISPLANFAGNEYQGVAPGVTGQSDPASNQRGAQLTKTGQYLVGLVFLLIIIYEFRDVLAKLFD